MIQYCRDIDQKNNAPKVVIDIGFPPFIELLVCVSILKKQKDILRVQKRTLHEEL